MDFDYRVGNSFLACFLSLSTVRYEIVTDLNVLGEQFMPETESAGGTGEQTEGHELQEGGLRDRGRRPQVRWRCRFCKKQVASQYKLREHWLKTHLKASQYQRFKYRTNEYTCPVEGCLKDLHGSRREFTAHIKSPDHQPAELLRHGIETWNFTFHNRTQRDKTISYLVEFGLLHKIEDENNEETAEVQADTDICTLF